MIDSMVFLGLGIGLFLMVVISIIPAWIIDRDLNERQRARLNILSSMAVGGILSDVFLHSLPEIWKNDAKRYGAETNVSSFYSGFLILLGLILPSVIEKVFTELKRQWQVPTDQSEIADQKEHNNERTSNNNNKTHDKRITGYINLLANTMDNFTHGLAMGGAFLESFPKGIFTIVAVLAHEIPHEFGDFGILLKSGFSWSEGVKFQTVTASVGFVGAAIAVGCSNSNDLETQTAWIHPFTAGAFLNIGLVNILPDLLEERNPKESFKQLMSLILGISIMAVVTRLGQFGV